MATQAQIAAVQQLYVGYMGRAADSAGLAFWANAIATGTATIQSVATGFTLSAEYSTAYAGLANDALVDKVYNNVLGRASDATGKAFWVAALASGSVTAATLVATIVTNLGAQDQATINNKVFVAQTYTDAVGTSYNTSAGASVIAHVDSTSASVSAAITAISAGTLAGGIPGLSLINAQFAATDAITAYGVAAATANPTFVVATPGVLLSSDATAALTLANTAHGSQTDATYAANVTNATNTLASAKAASVAIVGATALAAYDAAATADVAAHAAVTANATAYTAAAAGLNASVAPGSTVTYASLSAQAGVSTAFATVADVLGFLNSPSDATHRAALVTELNKVASFGAEVVHTSDLAVASTAADAALLSATTTIQTGAGASTAATNYMNAEAGLVTANTALAAAQAADINIAADQAIIDHYTALNATSTAAATAITNFQTANSSTVALHAVGAGSISGGTAPLSDVFYFSSKAVVAGNTGSITFGAGDSIVLGAGYTYNNGALTTGNGNALEFFLQKTTTGSTQLVVETANYGSSDSTVNATTGVVTAGHAAVITLTGVTADHLSVANGVVSYV
ncbi:DUF4214 domain-containing protein [Pseudomonas sp. CCI4.2]|uniref:DUF4214 domain-containing protein n=1 Tax=Pseudomonas sp. CCI4.2 TaxID=3048620 RepID=UPI002AC9CD8F|nr:DUF4214 domain-containing protein [Pseudomonas sp. CCI4.2]MEB0091588.1 DUF4214 domain-containing protein [Pseudomonas sp. CCI4.2]WPX51796.1 DUF4214 domain-containing protein [Pseudomonas sp. CCI4.2]